VGRLDADTEGLLLLTDDGAFALHVAHPSYNVPKRYLVRVAGKVTRRDVAVLEKGVELADGARGRVKVESVAPRNGGSDVVVTAAYGRKRMIRQMFASLRLKIELLRRVAVGPVEVGSLAPGEWRPLTAPEVSALYGRRP
jgi:23S rRNA pseudouridine2605 synthase